MSRPTANAFIFIHQKFADPRDASHLVWGTVGEGAVGEGPCPQGAQCWWELRGGCNYHLGLGHGQPAVRYFICPAQCFNLTSGAGPGLPTCPAPLLPH